MPFQSRSPSQDDTLLTRPPVCHRGEYKISPQLDGLANDADPASEGLPRMQHYGAH